LRLAADRSPITLILSLSKDEGRHDACDNQSSMASAEGGQRGTRIGQRTLVSFSETRTPPACPGHTRRSFFDDCAGYSQRL
jgi:hypothetical protein